MPGQGRRYRVAILGNCCTHGEGGAATESGARIAAEGAEVLMAAYRSALEDGARIALPLEDGSNPLV